MKYIYLTNTQQRSSSSQSVALLKSSASGQIQSVGMHIPPFVLHASDNGSEIEKK